VDIIGGWYTIRRHFFFQHQTSEVHVIKEGELPSCRACGFQCARPHDRHQQSDLCHDGQERQKRITATQAIILARDYAPEFMAGETSLDQVPSFKYLGRWLSANDSDVMAVSQNIVKARMRWGQLCHLLTRQGASRRVMGCFYKATVQSVLLFGAETWTLTQPLLRLLKSFHHRCARYLARMVNTQDENGNWVSPPSAVAHNKAGLFTIEEYIQCHVNTFLPFIQPRAIYQSCLISRPTQAASNHPSWWLMQLHRPAMPSFDIPHAALDQMAEAAQDDMAMPFAPPL